MIADFHFLRPWWLAALLPMALIIWPVLRRTGNHVAWGDICDAHLLPHMLRTQPQRARFITFIWLLVSAVLMVIALAGPTWSRMPVPTYKFLSPRVLVLELSNDMLQDDLAPNRLSRARFKLHDLLKQRDLGQFGLIVYTGEPFIVSPLTDDAQTIAALLHALTPDVMPVEGSQLDSALREAGRLITQAGFHAGELLVLTGKPPSEKSVAEARALARQNIHSSIMPVMKHQPTSNQFETFASAGNGLVVPFSDTSSDLETWIHATTSQRTLSADLHHEIPIWKDRGRWFLIPLLLWLLPAFQRGWLQRMST